MDRDNEFQPRLGRIRSAGSKRGRKYLHQVLAAVNRAGASSSQARSMFHGNRIGRGAGVGRVLAGRDRHAAFRQRRVVIKSRIVKLAGRGLAGARAHLRYIRRDGVTRDGERGTLYGPDGEAVEASAFHERSARDRHQFRFIVSPEDGGDYDSLRSLTCRLMARMEEDLGTPLDWVAVDHFNTGHPHTHVMLRGVDGEGRDLIIARDYLSTGMRERAAELVQLDLGPRTDAEIERGRLAEIGQERFTSLDRRLIAAADDEAIISIVPGEAARQTRLVGRLQKLKALGLAGEEAPGRWRLTADLEQNLRRLSERGDIIKTMHRELSAAGLAKSAAELAWAGPAAGLPVIGRVVTRGLADELADRHFLIVDGVDGRAHYIDIGRRDAVEPLPAGAIVRIAPRRAEARPADNRVAEIAALNRGLYSIDTHLRHDPSASQSFAEAHVRRLEALRRGGAGVERRADGSWLIAPDHVVRAGTFEQGQTRARPTTVEVLSTIPIEAIPHHDGVTWLDRALAERKSEPVREAGFGLAVHQAQQLRRRWLVDQALASERDGVFTCHPDMIESLRRRELLRVATQLSGELGLAYVDAQQGDRVEGTFRRTIELASGRYALVERAKDFALVPWRPVLKGRGGQAVTGVVRSNGTSWSFERQRTGPQIY